MEGRRVNGRRRLFVTTLLVAMGLSLSCGSISKDEISCEQAVSKLSDCCPNLDERRLPCVEVREGCTNDGAQPTLNEHASECVLDASCEALRSSGTCDRLIALSLVPHVLKDRREIETEACR